MRAGALLFVLIAGFPASAVAQDPPPKPPESKPAPPVEPVEIEETVTVTATRTGARLDDSPTRVEVLVREEIEEKMLMTPGDIVMMLNEMGGMRVQTTSPSLGAASVRIQGMKGRYTRVLADGLPLFGQQVGGLGLLQIPPMDLGQVEVIKGVASALYGSGAMGGVVNLISRRPGDEPVRDFLINQATAGATDGVAFLSGKLSERWSASLLGGGHRQSRNDIDDDGWADLAGYGRGVVRPRVFWDNGAGGNLFITAGATVESRDGGTVPGAVVPDGQPYVEALDTERYDAGGSGQFLAGGRYVVTMRAAASTQRHDHAFGPVLERDRHSNVFGEAGGARAGRRAHMGGRRGVRTRPLRSPRRAAVRLHVQHPRCLRAGRHHGDAVAVAVGQRTAGCARRIRHVLQPAGVGARPRRRLDQPAVGGPGLRVGNAADRGNRGRGAVAADDSRSARGRARHQRVVGHHQGRRAGVVHRDGVRVLGEGCGPGRARRRLRAVQRRRFGADRRPRTAGDVSGRRRSR